MVDIATLGIRIDSREALTAAQSLERMRDSGARAEQQAASLDVVTRKLSQALQLLGVGAGVGAIIRMADEYTKFTAQLQLATQSQREYAAAVDDVRRIANTAQQDLAATGMLYARISNGTRELGVQQKQVAAITETVNLALKVSGATAAESASAQLQLSQAFAAGALRGEEFNAVNEAAPRLMKALADGLGVPIGALKKMAEEGLLTTRVMSEVLPKSLDPLKEESKQIQTIGGSFTVLKNSVMEFIGTQAKASGTVMALTTGIEALARNLNLLAGVAGTVMAVAIVNWLTAWTMKTYEHITAIYAQVAAANAARAATIASAEAEVVSTAATTAGLAATQASIVVAREETVARLAVANANMSATQASIANTEASIAQARAAIAASTAAGALSTALRVLRDSTRELNVQEALRRGLQADLAIAEQARSASLAQLAILGQQQTRVSAQVTAATAAQAAAQATLTAANGAAVASVGLLSRTIGFLGGPIGAVITLLGLAATAWSVWGKKSEDGNKQAVESFEQAQVRIIKGLDERIAKNEKLIELQNSGMSKPQADKNLPVINQIDAAQKKLDSMNSSMTLEKGQSWTQFFSEKLRLENGIVELRQKMAKDDAIDRLAKEGTRAQQLTKWYGENGTAAQRLAAELDKLKKQFGEIPPEMEKLVRAKFIDKDGAATAKATVEARVEAIKAGIEHERNLRVEGVARITELNRQGLAGDTEVYNAKHAAALAAGKDAAAIFDAEIAALSAYNGKDAAERIANNAKIKDLGAQRTEALRASLVAADQLSSAYAYDKDKPARDAEAASRKEIVAINDQIDATERQIAAYNKLPSAVTESTIALLEEQKAALAGIEGSEKAVADIDMKIAAYSRLTKAQKTLQGLDTGTDVAQAERLLKILQAVDDAARQAAQGMAESFGRVGSAIGGLTTALTGYAVQQQAIAAQLAAVKADPKSSAEKIAQAEIAASKASAQAQIKSYGDMAGAAKGFFSENSKGYKVLEATEKAFRAYEMAMAVESMVKKIFYKEGEVAANTALNATKLTGEAATTAASTGLAATEASAWGVTAVVKAIASLPFPLNLAAGAATLAAVVAIGAKVAGSLGGGGANVAQQRQDAQGTGSVLGDSSAKSDSISRAIALTAENTSVELSHTAGMLATLKSIDNNIAGLGSLVVRTTGITGNVAADTVGSAQALTQSVLGNIPLIGGVLGGTVGKLVGSIFGGATTVDDTGIVVGKNTVSGIATGGVNADQYTDTTKKGGWFSSDKHNAALKDLGAQVDDQFTKVILGLSDSINQSAVLLGVGGDAFTARLNSFVVDLGKISLKGLTGEQIQEQLEAVFSKLGDQMAQFAIPDLGQFQKVGEGYFETLTRIASNYANLDAILASSGATFGQTGLASIAARERLIELTGGIDKLASQQSGFNDNFLTQAERLAPVQKYVTDQLAAMGLQSLDTRDKFKEYVLGIANSGALATEAGAQQYAALLALSEAFAKTHAATVDLTKSEQEIADERTDLQSKLDELIMTQEQLAAKARSAIDSHNQALYDQVQAAQAAKDAIETAAAAAEALASTNANYQHQIDQLLAAREGEAAVRALETAGMAASTVALYDRLSALKEEQAAAQALANTNAGYQQQIDAILKASMSAEQVRAMETAGMAASTVALYDRLAALKAVAAAEAAATAAQAAMAKALIDAVSNAYGDLQSAIGREKDALAAIYQSAADGLQVSLDKVSGSVSNLQSLSDALHSTLDGMQVPGQEKAERQAAQAQIAAALAIAKAGGPLPDADSLKKALSTVSKDATGQFGSYLDYQRDLYTTRNNVAGLAVFSDAQLSTEQLTLKAIKDQKTALDEAHKKELVRLDAMLDQAKSQVDTLNGIRAGVASIPEALAALAASLKAASANPVANAGATTADAYKQYLGRDATASEIDYWKSEAAKGVNVVGAIANSDEAKIQELYRTLLGRAGDAAGVNAWEQALAAGQTLEQIRAGFMDSEEYKKLHGIPGFATGGLHLGGLRIVGENGPELEATGPSRIFNATQTASMLRGGGDNSELLAEMREMRREMAQLRAAGERTANSSETSTGLFKRVIRNDRIYASTKEEATA
ncbi:tape measure protein [Duganella sp. FT50W]|uniref:Tape measure protein n=1 Tax=Duganella lactea TaxID=2692173 RepID=A0A6L8MFC3_9BURK|nr:tape measure protein [Duganella lactea]MYM81079.1 tape measure protein [Duganella lactea]